MKYFNSIWDSNILGNKMKKQLYVTSNFHIRIFHSFIQLGADWLFSMIDFLFPAYRHTVVLLTLASP